MRIINVIECGECSLGNLGIIQIQSFPVVDEQLFGEVIHQAEQLFNKIALENGAIEEDLDSYIEDGTFQKDGEWSISIIWSEVNQV